MVNKIPSPTRAAATRKLGIIFRYSRANIYSYHALIGALEVSPSLSNIPVFIPTPPKFHQKLDQLLSNELFDHLLVGLSLATFQLEESLDVLAKLNAHPKRRLFTIIAGGPHPSAQPDDLLEAGADIVVIGEGEKTFPEVVKAVLNSLSIKDRRGIAYKDKTGKIIIRSKNDPINLDDYPPFAPAHQLYSALEITRGCQFGCKFCQTPSLFGRKVRYRSPKEIIRWGKFLLSKRANWDFRFIAPNAFGYWSRRAKEPNLKMIEELLSGLKAIKAKKRRRIYFGTFPSEVRPEFVTEETLTLVKKYCDNDNLTIGAQTGSPRIMKMIRRGHTIGDVVNAVDLARSFGFRINLDFILGFPEETPEDQYLTLEFCKEMIAKNCTIHMHYLIPLPGTAYAKVTPKQIVPEVENILRKWSNEGIIWGSWQHQKRRVIATQNSRD